MFFEEKFVKGGGPFVGEEMVMLILEVEILLEVMEVVVKVLVAMVERRGLPQDEFFLGTFSWLAPSPLSFLLFRFVDISISSYVLVFFFVFFGDGAVGVLGVAGFL